MWILFSVCYWCCFLLLLLLILLLILFFILQKSITRINSRKDFFACISFLIEIFSYNLFCYCYCTITREIVWMNIFIWFVLQLIMLFSLSAFYPGLTSILDWAARVWTSRIKTITCSRDCSLSVSWVNNWGFPWNPLEHNSTIMVLSGLRGPSIFSPHYAARKIAIKSPTFQHIFYLSTSNKKPGEWNFCHWACMPHTHREILLNQTKIKLYLPFSN